VAARRLIYNATPWSFKNNDLRRHISAGKEKLNRSSLFTAETPQNPERAQRINLVFLCEVSALSASLR